MTKTLLFTAFEPSGDRLAASVIHRLRSEHPNWSIHAWGGSGMARAGAHLHENTVEHAAMGLGALAHVRRVRRTQKSILRWCREHQPDGLVPVDSPAANFPICKALRPQGVRVVHLAAPQLWAWAPWRSRKLRKCTDQVLCLLPFEPDWFASRSIPAKFIGHPAINRELDIDRMIAESDSFQQGSPRLLLMPGSRNQEIDRNVQLMIDVVRGLRDVHPTIVVAMTAVDEEKARRIRRHLGPEDRIDIIVGQRDAALHWSQLVLAVSGTVTLDIMRHERPMVGVYRTGPVGSIGGRLLLITPDRLLPNLIAGSRIVPEFVPHWGGIEPIRDEVMGLLDSEQRRSEQVQAIKRSLVPYEGKSFAEEAADAIVEVITR
tara:strand:- start:9076 stop:10200 length:1125 start_codon:yes stop_codon:yes gene_type:complete